ncbi:unnamed protein product [Protopolystoma xenopodis]|uniref:Uncharacterized protein n=1 Tax=Protopolystoma xenopodis TaxID=117903 RepID=A0A3S5FFY3_9PLAT|nr:unnamed protein product [Protopolystoma xenopodis]
MQKYLLPPFLRKMLDSVKHLKLLHEAYEEWYFEPTKLDDSDDCQLSSSIYCSVYRQLDIWALEEADLNRKYPLFEINNNMNLDRLRDDGLYLWKCEVCYFLYRPS